MTKQQRRVLEGIIDRIEKGPSLDYMHDGTEESINRAAQIWAESWQAAPLRALLRADEGDRIAKAELRDWA